MSAEQGRIIRSISGFYDVDTGKEILRCRARGNFRKKGITPRIGDWVRFQRGGLMEEILPRKNELIRPLAANVDQVVLVLACVFPEPSAVLMERFIAMMRYQKAEPVLVFNKSDQLAEAPDSDLPERIAAYRRAGFSVFLTSAARQEGIDALREALRGKVSVFSGPSGVGKSSLLNLLLPQESQEVGDLSEKIRRGKNTTRVSELLPVPSIDAWVADTPGFTSLKVTIPTVEVLKTLYPEWEKEAENCLYQDCTHLDEPDCAIKKALAEGRIEQIRYDGYCHLLKEIQEQEPEYE